jgi:hypothetical protein
MSLAVGRIADVAVVDVDPAEANGSLGTNLSEAVAPKPKPSSMPIITPAKV